MKMTRLAAPLAFLVALGGGALSAQEVPLDVEVGYRFTDVTGNQDMYRSQVNEREGFLIRSLNFANEGFGSSFMDSFRLDASDLGVGPAGALRLTAGKSRAWRLELAYRRTEHFSAEPGFANPLLGRGIIPGQHTMDRERNTFGVELSILPGSVITPFVGYSRNRYEGPGTTTYTVGGDEFRLRQDLYDTEQEVHVGVNFDAGMVSGKVMQGWRKFVANENLTLIDGAGNGTGTVLGTNVTATNLTRYGRTDVNTPETTAVVTVTPISRLKLLGSYVRASAGTSDLSQENASGSFVSFAISRFFTGLEESTRSDAQNKVWRGGVRAEWNVIEGLDVTASYWQRHRELTGTALISSLYVDATTFAGLDKKTIVDAFTAATSLERTDKTLGVTASYKALGPVALRLGYATEKQEITVTEDPSEIVVPGSQGGDFDRKVDRLDAGLSFRMSGVFFDADSQKAKADIPVVRTDFISRDRYRLRAGYGFASLFKLAVSAEQVDTKNDWTGIDRDGRMRQYGGDLTVTPMKLFFVRVSGHRFQGDNSISYRFPQNFTTATSVYSEDGKSFELGGGINLDPISVEGSFARLQNWGDNPFRMTRGRIGADLAVSKNFGVVLEWLRDKYEESDLHWGDFNANRYGVYLRFHP